MLTALTDFYCSFKVITLSYPFRLHINFYLYLKCIGHERALQKACIFSGI